MNSQQRVVIRTSISRTSDYNSALGSVISEILIIKAYLFMRIIWWCCEDKENKGCHGQKEWNYFARFAKDWKTRNDNDERKTMLQHVQIKDIFWRERETKDRKLLQRGRKRGRGDRAKELKASQRLFLYRLYAKSKKRWEKKQSMWNIYICKKDAGEEKSRALSCFFQKFRAIWLVKQEFWKATKRFSGKKVIRLPQEIFSRKYEKYEKEEQCYIKHLLHLIVYLLTFLSSFSINTHDSTSWLRNYGYIKWYLNVILYVLFLILIPDTVW